MLFRFVSEKAAEDFIRFVADEYEVELELNSYLHVEVDYDDFPQEEASFHVAEEAERFGADVL
jgi:hypothetical protein